MSSRLRLVIFFLAIAASFALVAVWVPHSPAELRDAVPVSGWGAVALLLLAWIVLTPALVSGTLLAVATGLLLGAGAGVPVSIAGATLGGGMAFLAARRIGHRPLEQLSGARLRKVQERLSRRGFLAVFLVRLSPAPATVLHYAAGLSRIRAHHFVAGIALGGTPRLFAYTALGGSGGDLGSPLLLIAVGVLGALSVGGALVAWHRRTRKSGPPSEGLPPLLRPATTG